MLKHFDYVIVRQTKDSKVLDYIAAFNSFYDVCYYFADLKNKLEGEYTENTSKFVSKDGDIIAIRSIQL